MTSNKIVAGAAVVAVVSVGWLLIRPAPAPAPVAAETEPSDSAVVRLEAAAGLEAGEAVVVVDVAGVADRSETGAMTAARAYLEMGEVAAVLDWDAVVTLWRSVATEDSVDGLIAQQRAIHDQVRAEYRDGIPARMVAMEARLAHYDGTTAVVDMWIVSVLEVPGGPAAQSWMTGTYRLEWVNDRWLIAKADTTAGPTPALSPLALTASTAVLTAALDGYDDPWRN